MSECLTEQEIRELSSEAKKLPDKMPNQKIETLLKKMENQRMNGCEMAVQNIALFKKFEYLLNIEKTLRDPKMCFTQNQVNEIIKQVKNDLTKYTDQELYYLIRSIDKNNSRLKLAQNDPSYQNCQNDLTSLLINMKTSLKLEKDRRLSENVPKTVDQRSRLDLLSEEATIRKELQSTKEKLPNHTLRQLSMNLSETVLGVIDDFLNKPNETNIVEHIIETLTKENRPIYLGMILITISIVFSLLR